MKKIMSLPYDSVNSKVEHGLYQLFELNIEYK